MVLTEMRERDGEGGGEKGREGEGRKKGKHKYCVIVSSQLSI